MQIVKPNSQRIRFLYIQIFTGILLLVIIRLIYTTNPHYISFIGKDSKVVLEFLFWFLIQYLILQSVIKYLFQKKLDVTKLTRIYEFFERIVISFYRRFKGEKVKIDWQLDPQTRTAFLAIVVKVFYVPIMLGTVTGNGNAFINDTGRLLNGSLQMNFDVFFNYFINLLFLIDTFIFTFGYLIELDFLGNKIKSVEPTMLGWVAALSTYPPFNSQTGTFFPLYKDGLTFLGSNIATLRLLQICILLCHTGFVLSSISLGAKGSNLTSRGVVQTGMYRFVRHPAYVTKLSAWFIEGLLYAPNIFYFPSWFAFVLIYYTRAWTEERHLSTTDPDYLEYKKKVKWMFIPRLV